MADKKLIQVIIRNQQTILQSVLCDTYSCISQILVIGAGAYLNSALMQWVGFIVLCLFLICRASGTYKYSIKEAIEKLQKMEQENDSQ